MVPTKRSFVTVLPALVANSPVRMVTAFLQLFCRNTNPQIKFACSNTPSQRLIFHLEREEAEEAEEDFAWDLLPFDFLYDLYRAWFAMTH